MDQWSGFTHAALQNHYFRLEILEKSGPRILKLIPSGTEENLLAYTPDICWQAPAGMYSLIGGHRLWVAPEDPAVTYLPEDEGVDLEFLPDGVRLRRTDHFGVQIEKTMEIHISQDRPEVQIVHRIRNLGANILRAAPWAISALPLGARIKIPLATGNTDPHGLLANRALVLWPYARLEDPRIKLTDEAVYLQGDPLEDAFKMGVYTTRGWAAAQIHDWLLVKRFNVLPPERYPDMCSNVETFVRDRFIEFETLGPLADLRNGEFTEHIETWQILHGALEDLDSNGNLKSA